LNVDLNNVLASNWGHQEEFYTPGTVNFPPEQDCPADFDQDGVVGVSDFIQFNSFFGNTCNNCVYDLSGDGEVGVADFLIFNSEFGMVCGFAGIAPSNSSALNQQFAQEFAEMDQSSLNPELLKAITDLRDQIDLTVYPNPNDGTSIRLDITGASLGQGVAGTIHVVDMSGKTILVEQVIGSSARRFNQQLIFDAPLVSGLYLIRVESETKHGVARFVVE